MSIKKIKTKDHAEWLQLRKKYIGGSDAAAVVGMNSFASPYSLWAEKTGKIAGFEGNLATEVGTFLEEFVAQKFAQETGKKVRKCNYSILNSQYPFAIANIDREIVGEDAGLEIKTTDTMNLKKFKGGEYPANYYVQCVHYLAVTGKQRWYLAVLIGNKEFKWFVIERDEDEIAALMKAEAEFAEFIKTNTPPMLDGEDATSNALSTIYAENNEEIADLALFDPYLKLYAELGRQKKEIEKQQQEAANRVKAFMGESGGGKSEGFRVSWKVQERSKFDADKFAAAYPDIDLTGFYNTTSARVFRVTELKGA